jgi:hypothetical protein
MTLHFVAPKLSRRLLIAALIWSGSLTPFLLHGQSAYYSGHAFLGSVTNGEKQVLSCDFDATIAGETFELKTFWVNNVVSCFTDDGQTAYSVTSLDGRLLTNNLKVTALPARTAAMAADRDSISFQPELVRAILFTVTGDRRFDSGLAPFEPPGWPSQDIYSTDIKRQTAWPFLPITASFTVDREKRLEALRKENTPSRSQDVSKYLEEITDGMLWGSYTATFQEAGGYNLPVESEFQYCSPSHKTLGARIVRVVVTEASVSLNAVPITSPQLPPDTYVQDVRTGKTYGYMAKDGAWLTTNQLPDQARELKAEVGGAIKLPSTNVLLALSVIVLLIPVIALIPRALSKMGSQTGR